MDQMGQVGTGKIRAAVAIALCVHSALVPPKFAVADVDMAVTCE